jgi:electron transport complex protein RnfG
MAAPEPRGWPAALFATAVAAVAAALLSLSFEMNRARIAENRQARLAAQLGDVLGDIEYDNDIATALRQVIAPELLGSDDPADIYVATRNGVVAAVVLSAVAPNGYNGPIELLVGIDRSGHITGVRVAYHRETPGLGDAIEADRSDWIEGFDATSLTEPPADRWRVTKDGGQFDTITGATVTPRAVTEAVRKALVFFRDNQVSLLDSEANISTTDAQ